MSEKNYVFKSENKKQLQFIEAVFSGKYSVLLFGGAIRGGKTFVALAIAIMLCKIFPKSRWTIVRKDLKRLKDNTRPAIDKFIEGTDIKVYENSKFIFPNGSVIMFKSENYDKDKSLESFKGHETNGFILEEVSEIKEATYNKCIERAGSYVITPEPEAGQPPPLIIMTCNPTQAWVKKLIYDPWKKGSLPKHIFYLPSYVTDNEMYLSASYIQNLKNLPIYEYEVFVLGNWDVALKAKNAFWHALDVNEHIKPVDYDPARTIHISIDANVMPYCTATIWQINIDKKEVYQVDEIIARDPYNHATGLGRKVVEYLDSIDYTDTVFIYGDASTKNQNAIDEKKRSFYDIFIEQINERYNSIDYMARSNPQISKTGEFVNALYSGFEGWKLIINEICKESLSDYLTVKIDMDGTMQKKKVTDEDGNSYEEYGHVSDTKRYILYKMLSEVYHNWTNRFSEPPEAISIDLESSFDE